MIFSAGNSLRGASEELLLEFHQETAMAILRKDKTTGMIPYPRNVKVN